GKLTSMEDVNYTDDVVRKYAGLSFKVEKTKNSNKQSWSTGYGMELFYEYRPAIHDFARKDDYDINSSYKTVYDDNIFYSSKDKFILKSSTVKSFMLSSVVEESPPGIFAPSILKEAKYKLIQKVATFRLHKPRKYIDILGIQKKLSFWTLGKKMSLNSGDFLALTSKDDDWYYGDFVYNDGRYISGKILINDTFDGSKSIQNTKNYTLKIFHSPDDDKHREYLPMMALSEIYELKIYDKKNKLIQTIRNAGYSLEDNGQITMSDVNFDGYDDLMIYSHDGGAGPNDGYNFYIFNPKNRRFEYDKTLSNATQISIDKKRKLITAAWRNGAAEYGGEEYKWINGRFVMTKQVVMTYMDDDTIREETCTVSKNKQKCKTKYEKAEGY
ncbi:MAG: hypothetical protein L0Y61_06660, partial [Epsilonproteobacteria bacterium]|nr:hypothetical protein [Campylobacterota bacterium]